MNMKLYNRPFSIFGAVLAISSALGCAAISVKPGAEKVIVTRQSAPKSCKYLGSVVGNQGGSLTGGLTSNRNLAEGATNDMKNKAFDMGANYVVLETNQAGSTQSGDYHSFSGQQTDVTNTGNAYHCPPEEIGLN
jgi:hypothetical protein